MKIGVKRVIEQITYGLVLAWVAVGFAGGALLFPVLPERLGDLGGALFPAYLMVWVAALYLGRWFIVSAAQSLIRVMQKGPELPFLSVGTTETLYATPHGLLAATTASLMVIGGASLMANVSLISVSTRTSGICNFFPIPNLQASTWLDTAVVLIDTISLPGTLTAIDANYDVSN